MGNRKSEISENLELWNPGTLEPWNLATPICTPQSPVSQANPEQEPGNCETLIPYHLPLLFLLLLLRLRLQILLLLLLLLPLLLPGADFALDR